MPDNIRHTNEIYSIYNFMMNIIFTTLSTKVTSIVAKNISKLKLIGTFYVSESFIFRRILKDFENFVNVRT